MLDKFTATNTVDAEGNPTGGQVSGIGLLINWQNGPLGRETETSTRAQPNGAFVETVIDAARQRIQFYQDGKFKNEKNEEALFHLTNALRCLNERTQEREARQVEGIHAV